MGSYLFFNSEHHLELGGGVVADFGYKFGGAISNPNQQKIQPTGVIGYRYQPYLGPIVIRAGYTPYLDKEGYKH